MADTPASGAVGNGADSGLADPVDAVPAWQAGLAALRASGAAEHAPVRFAFLSALARRAATQPAAIRQPLAARISAIADELARDIASRPAPPPAEFMPAGSASPLAELLAHISQHAHARPGAAQAAGAAAAVNPAFRGKSPKSSVDRSRQAPELKSVSYFRDEWSKLSTEQQLTQTLAQAPENAGPMNSQHLVLRSLQTMRDIAPDYLQGFMSYIDTLIWLDHADPTKPPGRSASGEKTKAHRR